MKTPLELLGTWKQYAPLKHWKIYTKLRGVIFQRTAGIFNPSYEPIDRRGEHLDILFICDLFHEGVGSDILQRRNARWLVNVEGSSQI